MSPFSSNQELFYPKYTITKTMRRDIDVGLWKYFLEYFAICLVLFSFFQVCRFQFQDLLPTMDCDLIQRDQTKVSVIGYNKGQILPFIFTLHISQQQQNIIGHFRTHLVKLLFCTSRPAGNKLLFPTDDKGTVFCLNKTFNSTCH